MQSPTRTNPPYIPIRSSAWPTRRMPRWLLVAAAVLVACAVAVALVHKPTTAERASDLRGVLQDVTTDIESCAGGVGESMTALHQVQAASFRSGTEVSDGISVAQQGAANCSPANNEQIDDLENYQVPESLASYRLAAAVTGLVAWAAPDAEDVQTDIATVLAARTAAARAAAQAELQRALTKLDTQRTAIDTILKPAIKSLGVTTAPPRLPG
jgi:hypothetical protein